MTYHGVALKLKENACSPTLVMRLVHVHFWSIAVSAKMDSGVRNVSLSVTAAAVVPLPAMR